MEGEYFSGVYIFFRIGLNDLLEYLGAREPRDSECLPSAARQPTVVREKNTERN